MPSIMQQTPAAAAKSALVVSAHSADFVWRAGGAIAQHTQLGYKVHIVCLSFGEREIRQTVAQRRDD